MTRPGCSATKGSGRHAGEGAKAAAPGGRVGRCPDRKRSGRAVLRRGTLSNRGGVSAAARSARGPGGPGETVPRTRAEARP
jgi:hypothetical protein